MLLCSGTQEDPEQGETIPTYAQAINELAETCAATSSSKGFWSYEDVGDQGLIPLKLALIHSEVTEALVVYRNEYNDDGHLSLAGLTEMQEEDFVDELADIVIRVFDLAGYYELDLGEAIINKMEKNRSRPHLHGKRF